MILHLPLVSSGIFIFACSCSHFFLAKCIVIAAYHLFLLLEFNFYLNLVENLCVIYVCKWLKSSLNFSQKMTIEWSIRMLSLFCGAHFLWFYFGFEGKKITVTKCKWSNASWLVAYWRCYQGTVNFSRDVKGDKLNN